MQVLKAVRDVLGAAQHKAVTGSRIRGYRLQEIRANWFARFPLCVRCWAKGITRLATQLDHIVALANGGKDFDEDDEQNRQGLCEECHKMKTAEDFGYTYTPKQTIGLDGWPIDEGEGGSKV